MITLHEEGVFLTKEGPKAQGPVSPAEGRARTLAWRILQAHSSSGDPEKLRIRFDAMARHCPAGTGVRHEGIPHPLRPDQLP